MHDIKDYSIGLLQPSSQDLHDKIFKLSPPLTLGKKEKFWEILQIIAYNEFKLRNNKSWYYGRKNGLTNWNELSEATVPILVRTLKQEDSYRYQMLYRYRYYDLDNTNTGYLDIESYWVTILKFYTDTNTRSLLKQNHMFWKKLSPKKMSSNFFLVQK